MSEIVGDLVAKRVSFDLTYRQSSKPREIIRDHIFGDPDGVEDSTGKNQKMVLGYGLETTYPGSEEENPRLWLLHLFSLAVGEAVHEVLEWFKLDGEVLVDPHERGDLNYEVVAVADEFAAKLFSLIPKERLENL